LPASCKPAGTPRAAARIVERKGVIDRVVPTGQTDTAYLAGGRRLGLRLWDGYGIPVVLVHGLLDCALGWEPYAQRTSRRLVAVDLAGLGGSDPPKRASLSGYAEDVLDALDQVGVERFMAVGHSLGGGVVAAIADREPTRVAGLVLMAPVGFGRVPAAHALGFPGVSHAVRLAMPFALGNRIAASVVYRAVVANGVAPDRELLERVRSGAAYSPAGVWAANRATVAAGNLERSFARRGIAYDGHVEVLWGREDRLVPVEHAEGVRAALPQARVTVQDDMGHHPQRECPDVLAAFLERALTRAEAAPDELTTPDAVPQRSGGASISRP
jgi:pimeloyl-ACP methyl ester carboxylesterase